MTSLATTVTLFAAICAVVAVTCSAIRLREWTRISHESVHFFLLMTVGITILCGVVYAVDRLFLS